MHSTAAGLARARYRRPMAEPARTPTGAALGLSCFARGQAFILRRPGLLLLGLLPALVVFVVLAALLITLAVFAGDLASWATPFANSWSDGVRNTLRLVLAVALVGAAAFAAYLLFVSLTLLAGAPIYEHIAGEVDRGQGCIGPGPDERWFSGIGRAVTETIRLLARTLPWTILILIIGLLPVIGQVLGAVLGAIVGGRFLALELIGPAMERRGRYLDDRLTVGKQRRGAVLGLGVPMFVCSVIPLLGVVLMPGAVAGGTLLVRALD